MTTDIERAARIGNALIQRVQSQNGTPESVATAERHINASVAKHDFDTLSAIDRFSMIRVDSTTVVLLIEALRSAGRHEDVEALALDHVLSYYDLLSAMNRIDGIEAADLPRRRAAASIVAFLFHHKDRFQSALRVIRRGRVTSPDKIMAHLDADARSDLRRNARS